MSFDLRQPVEVATMLIRKALRLTEETVSFSSDGRTQFDLIQV